MRSSSNALASKQRLALGQADKRERMNSGARSAEHAPTDILELEVVGLESLSLVSLSAFCCPF